eukprot:749914-Hanusia_phi.AAC.4
MHWRMVTKSYPASSAKEMKFTVTVMELAPGGCTLLPSSYRPDGEDHPAWTLLPLGTADTGTCPCTA